MVIVGVGVVVVVVVMAAMVVVAVVDRNRGCHGCCCSSSRYYYQFNKFYLMDIVNKVDEVLFIISSVLLVYRTFRI